MKKTTKSAKITKGAKTRHRTLDKVRFLHQTHTKEDFSNERRFGKQIGERKRESHLVLQDNPLSRQQPQKTRVLFGGLNRTLLSRVRLCHARRERRRAVIAVLRQRGNLGQHNPPQWREDSKIQCRG